MLTILRKCGLCQGSGVEVSRTRQPDGSYVETEITCRSCGGSGSRVSATLPNEIEDFIDGASAKILAIEANQTTLYTNIKDDLTALYNAIKDDLTAHHNSIMEKLNE